MATLSATDLSALLDLVRDLHDADRADLPIRCISSVRALIGAEAATYSDFDLHTAIALETTDPSVAVTAAGQEAFERHLHEHPLIMHFARTRDGGALKSSDFLSQSALKRLGLYNEFIKPFFGTHYQIALAIAARPSRVIGVSLARARRDFSERERLMLNVLRPHLAQAVRHAEMVAALPDPVEGDDDSAGRRQLIAIDLLGQIRSTTTTAEAWLHQFFGRARSPHQLPDPVRQWVVAQLRNQSRLAPPAAGGALVARAPGAQLTLRSVIRERGLFVLLEYFDPLKDTLRLAALGLTPREIEVLRWVVEGKATSAIAIIIGSSVRTVHKHLERIYRKLNVESRTAAAAAVHTLLRPGR